MCRLSEQTATRDNRHELRAAVLDQMLAAPLVAGLGHANPFQEFNSSQKVIRLVVMM